MHRAALVILVGCSTAPVRPAPLPELVQPADLMDPVTYDERTTSLRATLARSQIALDAGPVVTTCAPHHGIADCVRCEIANRQDTRGIDADMIDAVAIAFARYPLTGMLKHVALCRKIRYEHEQGTAPAGIAIAADARLMISIETFRGDFTLEQVVHHEVFHLIDRAQLGDRAYDDREWQALNPPAFAYADPAPDTPTRPSGFVNSYATTNELEDRASIFEYMMGQPQALCEIEAEDPLVRAKVQMIRERVSRFVRIPSEKCRKPARPPRMKSPIPLRVKKMR